MSVPEIVTILLPLPRIVTGERSGTIRDGSEERLCVVESVPVPIRSVTAAEAPRALALGTGGSRRTWHAYEGRLYAPLFEEAGIAPTPEAVRAALLLRVRSGFQPVAGEPGGPPPRGETVIDYRAFFERAHRNQGLRGPDGHRMRTVSDHGLAARDAEAVRLAGTLLLVDGVPMHPAPLPYYLVEAVRRKTEGGAWERLMQASVKAHYEHPFVARSESFTNPVRIRASSSPPEEEHQAWMVFEPWRGDEAREFAASLPVPGYDGRGDWRPEGAPDFEVIDRAALESAAGDRGLGRYAASASAWFLRYGTDLYARPDAVLERLMGHRRDVAALADGGSPEAAMESLRDYADLFVASGADPDGSGPAMAAREMMARYDAYERPRAGLEPLLVGDMAGLAALAR